MCAPKKFSLTEEEVPKDPTAEERRERKREVKRQSYRRHRTEISVARREHRKAHLEEVRAYERERYRLSTVDKVYVRKRRV